MDTRIEKMNVTITVYALHYGIIYISDRLNKKTIMLFSQEEKNDSENTL